MVSAFALPIVLSRAPVAVSVLRQIMMLILTFMLSFNSVDNDSYVYVDVDCYGVCLCPSCNESFTYDSLSDVGEIRVYQRADFQSGSRVLKKVF